MDLTSRLSELEEMVRDAKSMPLSSSALVNRDEVLKLIEDLKSSLPDEIKQARWVVKDREELLAKARRDAEAMVEQAVPSSCVSRPTKRSCSGPRTRPSASCRRPRKTPAGCGSRPRTTWTPSSRSSRWTLQKILEDMMASNDGLSRTIDQVVAGREKLRGATPSDEFGPEVSVVGGPGG